MQPRVPQFQRKQDGAIAILTGIALTMLFAVSAVVLDLGRVYILKSELQNASDAAALAGAEALDNTLDGVNKAVAAAKTFASHHKYNFVTTLELQDANIMFAAAPDGPFYSVESTRTSPAGRSFIRVQTDNLQPRPFLLKSTQTLGYSVAGRYVNLVTPIGICAVDPDHRTSQYTYPSGLTEQLEFGFRRGVAYNVFDLGRLGGAAYDPYLINPVDTPPACTPANSSTNVTRSFVCNGNSAVIGGGSGQVIANPGLAATIATALNSRFGVYGGGGCIASQAPPDINIKEYHCIGGGSGCLNNGSADPSVTPPINWMQPGANTMPSRSSVLSHIVGQISVPKYGIPPTNTIPAPDATFDQFADYGPLWAYTRPVQADGTSTISPATANVNPMYSTAAQNYFDTGNYPSATGAGFPASKYNPAPYNQTNDPNYWLSGGANGVRDRRILNLVLVDCRSAPVGAASCATMNAVGIGKFFMLNKADFSGPTPHLDVEFTGLVQPVPDGLVRLYR